MPVTFETLAAFVVTSVIIELTPGPNMAYLAMLSAVNGRRAGFAATAGVALGLLMLGLGAAFGLAALIAASPVFYETLRWGGVLYLLWLAYDGWMDSTEAVPSAPMGSEADVTFFTRGLVTNLLNPKAALFYVAVLPGFVTAAGTAVPQTVMLSLVYVAVATAIHITIVALAGAARPFLDDADKIRVTRRVLAVALALVAVWFAYGTAR